MKKEKDPMDSLAAVLRRIPLFSDLPPGSFAKIIADLREESYAPGTVICYEGDEAHDFYLIKSGQVEVLVHRGGSHPLALTLVICTTVAVWFLAYQSTCYLALYFGTKEQAFSHGQVRLLAWSYGLIYLLAILVAIPYWRWLGLLP